MALEELTCTPDAPCRLDVLVARMTGRSRAEVRGLVHHGCVTVHGVPADSPGQQLLGGEAVAVRHDPHTRYRTPQRERTPSAFRILFEDRFLIVVDKPAGILTVPTGRGDRHTLQSAVDDHLRRRGRGLRAHVVHRLDRDTSGLLVFASTASTAQLLIDQFRVAKAEREYSAIVAGDLRVADGTFESQLRTSKSLKRYSVRNNARGETAITHFAVERRLSGASLVRVRLQTGRRNQIRVHFAEAGHPVLGDDRYEPDLARHPDWPYRRLALHARLLGFAHPGSGEPLRFESPLPPEFHRFLHIRQTGRSGPQDDTVHRPW
jgi:23S rRNA pseudouridine1911/1915/1917 synthase